MKTAKLTSVLTMFSLVIFMSVSSIANSGTSNTGDTRKSGPKSLASATSEKDFSYLRFDVNKYFTENDEVDAINNSMDYLRFDVNNFLNENEAEVTELPEANEFEYLRFDVNSFASADSDAITELPVNELEYIRFDVTEFISSSNAIMEELPDTE